MRVGVRSYHETHGGDRLPSGLSWEQFLELPSFDLVRKRADYARIRVHELWLIDPEAPAVIVLRREGAEFVVVDDLERDGVLTSPLLPGLEIVVGELVAL